MNDAVTAMAQGNAAFSAKDGGASILRSMTASTAKYTNAAEATRA